MDAMDAMRCAFHAICTPAYSSQHQVGKVLNMMIRDANHDDLFMGEAF